MRAQREIRDAIVALGVFGVLIVSAVLIERHFGNPGQIEAEGQSIRVIDGDSFTIGETAIRLYGIDAPEYRQTCEDQSGESWECGRAARTAAATLLNQPGLTCETRARDRYGRAIAICRTNAVPDISAALVRHGWAISTSFGDTPAYPIEEASADRSGRGVWRGRFQRPADWREGHIETEPTRRGPSSQTGGE